MMKPEDNSTPPEAEQKDEQQQSSSNSSSPKSEGVSLSKDLIKSRRRKNTTSSSKGSDGGQSSGSSNGAGGNNSDNSALVSLGNTSFGFNFDSEEGNSSTPNSDRNGESDSDGGNGNNSSEEAARSEKTSSRGGRSNNNNKRREKKQQLVEKKQETDEGTGSSSETNTSSITNSHNSSDNHEGERPMESVPQHQQQAEDSGRKSNSSMTSSLSSSDGAAATASHTIAADAAVANLHTIASEYTSQDRKDEGKKEASDETNDDDKDNNAEAKTDNGNDDDSNGGYNTDDEGVRGLDRKIAASRHPEATRVEPVVSAPAVSVLGSSGMEAGTGESKKNKTAPTSTPEEDAKTSEPPKKKKKGGGDKKREERNAREKERSFRISKQINEVRELLSTGGVIVPKGTKSSVLTEAASYIRMLQQHQYRSEIDRHQLVQQIQMIGGGAHGPQAAQAIRHVAAKNGVWSLGNFGGVPPKSAMGYYGADQNAELEMQPPVDPMQQTKIEEHEYRSVFSNCAVGMAIASMGGAFIDCNQLFCQLSNYTKQEACALTIFNLTARQDLQHAFDLISQLISPPMDAPNGGIQQPLVLRGAMNNRNDLGLGVALVKGNDGIAKFFCVTLIKNPASPFDESPPIPATIDLIQGTPPLTTSQDQSQMAKDSPPVDSAPAFTTG